MLETLMVTIPVVIAVTIPSLAYAYGIKARIEAQEKQDSALKLAFEEIQRLLREVIAAKDTDSLNVAQLAANQDLLLQNSNTQSAALQYVVEFIKFNKR